MAYALLVDGGCQPPPGFESLDDWLDSPVLEQRPRWVAGAAEVG